MSELKPGSPLFTQKRLDSLNDIDSKIVSLLGYMSDIFEKFGTPSNNKNETKKEIESQTKLIYSTLSDIAIKLRKEVKIMDDNTGVFDQNEDLVMILPIPVDQKNTVLGRRRLKEEILQLKELIPETPTSDQQFIAHEPTKVNEEPKKDLDVKQEPKTDPVVKEEVLGENGDKEPETDAQNDSKDQLNQDDFGLDDIEMIE